MNVLNMLGKPCPIPVMEAKKALRAAAPGQGVAVLVDNDIARQNLEKMARDLGHGFKYEEKADGNILVTLELREAGACRPGEAGLVVAIGREVMGGGDDELGRALLKSFIHSLTELDTPPESILFFNGGARLAVSGSSALDDLAALAAKGCAVSTCGACLNFYGLAELSRVGEVTNMYAIAQTMAQAKKLINL